jgi:hypothetical protein
MRNIQPSGRITWTMISSRIRQRLGPWIGAALLVAIAGRMLWR